MMSFVGSQLSWRRRRRACVTILMVLVAVLSRCCWSFSVQPPRPSKLVFLHRHRLDDHGPLSMTVGGTLRSSSATNNDSVRDGHVRPPLVQLQQPAIPSNISTTSRTFSSSPSIDLNALKESIDIVSVIESYNLQRFERKPSGGGATACCPFHNDKTPSLSIDSNRRLYKCFGCGNGGDVFQFVREFHNKVKGQDLSYFQAVKMVQQQFGDPSLPLLSGGTYAPTNARRLTEEERLELARKRRRVLQTNAAAAVFYAKRLLAPPAGNARTYLQSRYLTPRTVKYFGMGYAPDAYYGQSSSVLWGEGSLVYHLKELNFTAREIVDAGLAIEVKKQTTPQPLFASIEAMKMVLNETAVQPIELNYESIMDRFRGRMIVPILDASGKNVLAFGGRILPGVANVTGKDYQPPKYLNSPETVVFQKKDVLFGESMARETMKADKRITSVILVEGYLDVIALSSIGIRSVVASMGTALSDTQLRSAVRIAAMNQGHVILCLDNDEAGVSAVERICSNGMLRQATEKVTGATVRVASLPTGMKDPADFVESMSGQETSSIAARFHSEIVDSAIDWTSWYVQRIMSGYDRNSTRGQLGSFSNIFERVAEFLADSLGPADRTKAAVEIAASLGIILVEDSNSSTVSDSVRAQLESDLLDVSSRIARTRGAIQRRVEAVTGTVPGISEKSLIAALSRGAGPSGIDGDQDAVAEIYGTRRVGGGRRRPRPTESKRGTLRTLNRKRAPPALTPHFSGFHFLHKSDSDWLGISTDKSYRSGNLDLTLASPEVDRDSSGDRWSKGKQKAVYFNSNDYHGHQFLTEQAASAGYVSKRINRDPSLSQKGFASLVQPDMDRLSVDAETGLLQILIHQPSTRTTLRNLIAARAAVGSDAVVIWSSTDKEWLFESLTTADESDPKSQNPGELRKQLAARPDCPPGSLMPGTLMPGTSDNTPAANSGSLDLLFDENDSDGEFASMQKHPEMRVQQFHATLLWTTSAYRVRRLQMKLDEILRKMSIANETIPGGDRTLEPGIGLPSESTSEFNEFAITLADLREATQELQSQATSVSRLTSRLLDQNRIHGVEGRMSSALQSELAASMDEFVATYKEADWPLDERLLPWDDSDEEPFEVTLERLEREWGEWFDDDYDWKSSRELAEAKPRKTWNQPDELDDDDESLEDALNRLDKLSKDWSDETGC